MSSGRVAGGCVSTDREYERGETGREVDTSSIYTASIFARSAREGLATEEGWKVIPHSPFSNVSKFFSRYVFALWLRAPIEWA